jgi:hypothetical protein
MLAAVPKTEELAKRCYLQKNIWSCLSANIYGAANFLSTYLESDRDVYDIRKQRTSDPFAHYSGLIQYLNRDDVRKELGVSPHTAAWYPCNMLVTAMFTAAGDV